MHAFQAWLLKTFMSVKIVSPFMHSKWGWPTCESLHFIGLSLLIGTIATFDLRLLGMAKRVPIGALHKLVPWGVGGYLINVTTGLMFLVTEPNQYFYNSAFHFKMLFMSLAGLNVLAFYSAVFRRVRFLPAGADAPLPAKLIGGISLFCWIAIIVCGRMLTFYRPVFCNGVEPTDFLSTCVK
jgi:uncharacterized membrane protein